MNEECERLANARHRGALPRYYQLPPGIRYAQMWATVECKNALAWWVELRHESTEAMHSLTSDWTRGEHLLDDVTVHSVLSYRDQRLRAEDEDAQQAAEIAAETNIPQHLIW